MLDIGWMKRLFVLLCGFPTVFICLMLLHAYFFRLMSLFFHCVHVKFCFSTAASGMYKIVRPAVGESLRYEI